MVAADRAGDRRSPARTATGTPRLLTDIGSREVSECAFRLLRWISGRQEHGRVWDVTAGWLPRFSHCDLGKLP
ncbi:hypothetical protein C1I98_02205 [Spongiactinospora gelatinilytica]|uniref:Uncharacterized protein n=1 Tax=Spongiactinospora gelatinilytica TaxID=2666298 RepID=A0A2W2HZA2_9ACTN|nr:hypothetical protein C1I98_02205 [Spongiactinospora gelatinilytica]